MKDYKPIAAQLARVRRAWKRTAALAGLAVTILETAGMFTVVLLIDLLFRPGVQGRLVLLGLVLGAAALLFARHVLRPLFRRISDERIALHIEEHNPAFEGALIAAAEFGPGAEGGGGAPIVETILREAARRGGRLDVRSVTSLLRMRKYLWLAAAVVAAYAAAGLLFPQSVGRHAARVIAPWKTPDARPAPVEAPAKPAIEFALSATNADVLRGAAFRLEASLSREPDTGVQLHFRSFGETNADSRWYAAAMQSVEKVRAYEGVLPDINEDMECYVSAERFRSAPCRVRVYDPLAVEAIEVAVRYPAYLQLPDRVERRADGDVSAPEGAEVTVRVLANRPLKAGRIQWSDGASQPLTRLPRDPNVAAFTFAVATNRAYRFRVEDAMGQVVESPSDAYVKVVPDAPPAIVLRRPATLPASVTPLSELTLEAGCSDDFGLASVDLVFRCGAETDGPEQRRPLALPAGGGGVETLASLRFELEGVQPRLAGGEVITWFLEARDRKGQTAVTDLAITPVRHFDVWATEAWEDTEAHAAEEPPSLAAILQSAFQIAARRGSLAPLEIDRQADDLAQTMVNPTTRAVWVFVSPAEAKTPQDAAKVARVNALAVEGHGALSAHRVEAAVDALRRAVTLMISMGLLEELAVLRTPPPDAASPASANAQMEAQADMLAALERQAAAEARSAGPEPRAEQADKTAEVQKKLDALAAEQKQNAEKARELEQKAAAAASGAAAAPEPKGARAQAAGEQQKTAEKVRKAADEVAGEKGLDAAQRQRATDAMREAARRMDSAAGEMREGRVEKAAAEAEEAQRRLATARDELGAASQEKLAEALARAESLAGRAQREQNDIRQGTEAAAQAAKSGASAARTERDMKALSGRQVRVKADLDALQDAVAALKQAVDGGAVRPETAAHIQDAERELRRGRAPQKAVNAAVAMAAMKPDEAAGEQVKLAGTLDKAHASLRQASDSMATGHEAELKRARNEAERTARRLAELKAPAASAADRRAAAEDAVDTAGRLSRHVAARDFVSQPALKALQTQVQQAQGAGRKIEEDKAQAAALAGAVQTVHAELDTAYEKLAENRRLFSSQREECPPAYRPLVNGYFEALSGKP